MKKIELRGKYGRGKYALVDDDDYDFLNQFFWGYFGRYAERKENRKTVTMHRVVLKAPHGMVVDHINGDKLDNRKSNLRIVNKFQNAWNLKNTTGVCFSKKHKLWQAEIKVNGVRHYLGRYKTRVEAEAVYQSAKKKYHKIPTEIFIFISR